MVLATIAAIILVYVVVMFLLHELFRKFFHMVFFISLVLFVLGIIYVAIKGA